MIGVYRRRWENQYRRRQRRVYTVVAAGGGGTISFLAEMGLQGGNTIFWPGTQAVGDMAIAVVANKLSSSSPTTPSGWTALTPAVVGTGTDGVGTGPILVSAFYMELVTASPADVNFTFTPNVVLCCGTIYRKSGGTWAVPTSTTGSDTSTGTGFSATGSDLAVAAGDFVTAFSASTANTGITGGRSVSIAGWTVTDTGLNSGGTATGNALFVWTDYLSVTSGSGSAVPTAAATHAASTSGGSIFVKVSLSGGGATSLTVQNASHSHSVGSVALTQVHNLTVQNASHAHTVQSLAVTQTHILTVQTAGQTQTAQNTVLTQTHVLTVQAASHGHTAANVVLTQANTLTVQGATQANHPQNVVLTQTHVLVSANASQGQTAQNITLTQTHVLVVQGAVHGHTVQSITFGASTLTVQSATHGHTAQNRVIYLSTNVDPRGSLWTRTDLLFGSCIGAWEFNGGDAFNIPAAETNTSALGLTIIRYQMWRTPTSLGGSEPLSDMAAALADIIGIGALPIVGLPPIWNEQYPSQPDPWSVNWQKAMIDTGAAASTPVVLYELSNEPDNYGSYDGQEYFDNLWVNVPTLKAYARTQGYGEIFIGGPSWANSYSGNLTDIETWLTNCHTKYIQTGNRDWLPDFVSTHTYLITPTENDTQAHAQARIDAWETFYGDLKTFIDTEFATDTDRGYLIKNQLRLATTEYNATIDNASTVNDSQTWTDFYMQSMNKMFRDANIFIALQFTILSHDGGSFDLLTAVGAKKPLYNSFDGIINGWDLVVANAAHTQVVPNVVLTQTLTVNSTHHAQTATSIGLGGAVAVNNAAHAHSAQNAALTQVHSLTAQGVHQTQSSATVSLSGAAALVVQNAAQGHSVVNTSLTQVHKPTVQSAAHTQTAGSTTLTQVHVLTVQGARQLMSSTSVDTSAIPLVIQSATQAVTSTQVILIKFVLKLEVEPLRFEPEVETSELVDTVVEDSRYVVGVEPDRFAREVER